RGGVRRQHGRCRRRGLPGPFGECLGAPVLGGVLHLPGRGSAAGVDHEEMDRVRGRVVGAEGGDLGVQSYAPEQLGQALGGAGEVVPLIGITPCAADDQCLHDAVSPPIERWLSVPVSSLWHADRKSTRLNSSHVSISYAVFCLKKKTVIRNT